MHPSQRGRQRAVESGHERNARRPGKPRRRRAAGRQGHHHGDGRHEPAQARRFGAVERNVYSYSDRTRGVSGSLSFGAKFIGADAKIVDIRRTLVEATARTQGSSRERERFDCLDQLR